MSIEGHGRALTYLVFAHFLVSTQYLVRTLHVLARIPNIAAHAPQPYSKLRNRLRPNTLSFNKSLTHFGLILARTLPLSVKRDARVLLRCTSTVRIVTLSRKAEY
jgi:hypothetical protein